MKACLCQNYIKCNSGYDIKLGIVQEKLFWKIDAI